MSRELAEIVAIWVGAGLTPALVLFSFLLWKVEKRRNKPEFSIFDIKPEMTWNEGWDRIEALPEWYSDRVRVKLSNVGGHPAAIQEMGLQFTRREQESENSEWRKRFKIPPKFLWQDHRKTEPDENHVVKPGEQTTVFLQIPSEARILQEGDKVWVFVRPVIGKSATATLKVLKDSLRPSV